MLELVILVLVVLVVVYISKASSVERRLETAERELKAHRSRLQMLEERLVGSPGSPAVTAPAPATPPQPASASPPAPILPQPAPQATGAPVPSPKPSRTREEWEALIGGKLLNRIGAVALIIGIGFFLKYAFDNDWINEPTRVLLGGVAGIGLLAGAERSQRKGFQVFSQGLIGAGLSVLYLSVYASFNFYALIPQWMAFVLMSAVTALSFVEAFRNDALSVGLLGLIGGFLTPFMLSTGEANQIGLFTYIALLDAGILAVVVMRERWVVLHALALVGTYVVYFLWHIAHYTDDALAVSVYFLSVFWVLFHVVDVLRAFRSAPYLTELREVLGVFNVLLFYSLLYAIVRPDHEQAMAAATLVLGALYAASSRIVQSKLGGITFARSILTAIVLLVIATGIQFSGYTTVSIWAVEVILLVWLGVRRDMSYVWISGVGLVVLAMLKLLGTTGALGAAPAIDGGVVFNERALAFLALTVASAASGFLVGQSGVAARSVTANALYYFACIAFFALLTVETHSWFKVQMQGGSDIAGLKFTKHLATAVVWAVYAVALQVAGRRTRINPLVISGLGVLACSILTVAIQGFSYQPVEQFTLVWNLRFASFALVLGGVAVTTKLLSSTGSWPVNIVHVAQVAFVLLLFVLLTGETWDVFERKIALAPEFDAVLENLQHLSLSSVWLVYSIGLMGVGLWKRTRGLRIISMALFGFTILKIFIYDLSFLQTVYRMISFIALGLILLAVSYLYQRYKGIILGQSSPGS